MISMQLFPIINIILLSFPCSLGFQAHLQAPRITSPTLSSSRLQKSSSLFLSSTSTTTTTSSSDTISDTEIQSLFNLLADSTLLYDPSRGTCCRNKCSGCTYLDSSGNFLYDEYSAATDENNQQGWLAPYVKVDFGERVQTSKWSTVLFPPTESANDDDEGSAKKKEIERKEFTSILEQQEGNISPLAIQALWNILSPSVGYPRLSSTEIIRAIKGMEGAVYEMGGAATYDAFAKNLLSAADDIQQRGGLGNEDDDANALDYDAMTKEELLELCVEREMKTNFPKMKRIIIEELRFFDANGRQGKRHPVKNTLS